MKIGRIVRRLVPPILLDLFYFAPRHHETADKIWEGIYPHYRDVPVSGPLFDSDTWTAKTRSYTRQVLVSAKQSRTIPLSVTGEHMLLPLLAAVVCETSGGELNILDFGGGMGITYVHLMSSLVNCRSLNYHVIERAGICKEGAALFETDDRIHFWTEVPENLAKLDIVYMSSALQYVEDYRSLLRRLAALGARYFLFVKLSAGDFPTYATAQKNVPGTTLPYWFLNIDELVEVMAESGYSLRYKSALDQEYDQSNFPSKYRLGRACNLLFSKI
ncbi:MAG TPA: methyltransferase, TIGR04325 family [Pyrinomonadaceae bacterium]|nr:methyltransferase, TIGR04325 family [Pyrinomonadaceae bacterium]